MLHGVRWKPTTEKRFKKAGFVESVFTPGSVESESSETSVSISGFEDEDDMPLYVFTKLWKAVFDCEVTDLGSIDSELPTCNTIDWELPMSDLIDCINSVRNDDGVDNDDDDNHDIDNSVSDVCSKSEILESLSKVKNFALHHGHSQMLNSVMELEDISIKTFLISSKQSQITDFF